MKKLSFSILALTLLTTMMLAAPLHAVTYTVTMNLYKDGELICTRTFTVEGPESPVILAVPSQFYAFIVAQFGTDTFTSPFTWTFEADGHTFTLEVIFEPPITVIFRPCFPGDANGDGKVNLLDAAQVSAHWTGPPSGPLGYDLNADLYFDGSIDVLDAAQVSVNWGTGYSIEA